MTEYSISPAFDKLITAVYEGPLEKYPWQGFLCLLREAVAANYSTLLLRPPQAGDVGVVLNALVASHDIYSSYNETYFALDPFVNLPPGQVITLKEFLPIEEHYKSDYYHDYLVPAGVHYLMGADMVAEGVNARLRVTRDKNSVDFTERDKQICAEILPHLQRSIVLHSKMMKTETERALYANIIGHMAMGAIILDEHDQVLTSNKMAQKFLTGGYGLSVTDGKLTIGHRDTQKQFQLLLEEAKSLRQSLKPAYARALRIPSHGDLTGIGLLIKPIPAIASSKGESNPAIAIFISDPKQAREPSAQLLSQLFNLSPAETNLALQLANGLTLDQASKELGISRNTAKTQLSSIFAKTGVTRQANLVQLILKSVAPIG